MAPYQKGALMSKIKNVHIYLHIIIIMLCIYGFIQAYIFKWRDILIELRCFQF